MYIHLSMRRSSPDIRPELKPHQPTRRQVRLPCACAALRRAARAVTQLYDRELRPAGLRVTQFSLLQALEGLGEAPQGRLGEVLAIDSTTLTRSLRPLIRRGWVVVTRGEDRRERRLRLSEDGRLYLKAVQPNWHRAQTLLQEALGDEDWAELNKFSDRILVAAEGT